MLRGGIPKCFECQKLATIRCFECLNEFEEPKTFCFICDNSIHKGLLHQKETISFNQQLDNLNQQYSPYQEGQNNSNNLERRLPPRTNELRGGLNNIDHRQPYHQQLQLNDNPRENLQFFKDLKYTSNHQSVKNNISEDRFKNAVAGPFYSNRNQSNLNYTNNFNLRQNTSKEVGRTFSHQQDSQQTLHQHNHSLQNEPRFTEDFEQRYQHKIGVKKFQTNYLQDNQLLTQTHENRDSFLSNEEDKAIPISNPLQQGLSDEEGEKKGIIKSKTGQSLLNRQTGQGQINEKQTGNNLTTNLYTKSSDQFKQQLEQEINDLKKYQNIHYHKYKSNYLTNQENVLNEEENQVPNKEEYVLAQQKNNTIEEEYKSVKNDIKQYFGQKELDDRENEVLKRISEIKKRIQPSASGQAENKILEQDRGNKLIHNYKDLSDKNELQSRETQQNTKTIQSKRQKLNSNIEKKEQEISTSQAGSANKYKNDFENLIGQVGPNEEKSYIEGLKNIYQQEIKNIEIKHKIKIQELENTISYLRQHMDQMEERNKDNILQIQQDLMKQQKMAIEQERDQKYGLNEMRLQYQEEINHQSLQLETEKAKYIQLEKKVNEYQQHYQHKLREMADLTKKAKLETEAEKVKLQEYIDEMEEKIEDMRVRMIQENELALQKIKIDYESSIDDQKEQFKEKCEQIAKLEKQLVIDSQSYHEKERELKKENQELERQVNHLKNELGKVKENTEQFKNIATDQENELELARRENELLEEQKQKLEEEKVKLEEQVEKYQKYIYGDKKEKSILQQLKSASSRPSLSRASSTSLKSTSSKNNKKKDN